MTKMNHQKKYKKPPLHKRIIFWILLPVIITSSIISVLLTTHFFPKIESHLKNQYEANLRLSSNLGLNVCDTHFNQLLDMRLENNLEMNRTLQGDALVQIKKIEQQVLLVRIIVLEKRSLIKLATISYLNDTWRLPSLGNDKDIILVSQLGREIIKVHIRYFPYWDWHIVSFLFEKDIIAPLATVKKIIYFSTMAIILVVFFTIFLMFSHSVSRPLKKLVAGITEVSKGNFLTINLRSANEIGQLAGFFNNMIDSLKKTTIDLETTIKKLRESESRYKSLVELSPEAVFVHQNGLIKYINNSGVKIFGTSDPQELIDRPVMDLIHQDFHETEHSSIEEVYKNKSTLPPKELKYLKLDKESFTVESTGAYIEYSGKPAMLTIIRDITERQYAENALRESEEKFRNIAENSLVGVNIIQDDILIYVNPKFAEIFDYSISEFLNNMHFSQLVYPKDLGIVKKNINERISGKTQSVNYAFRGVKKSGEIVYVEIFGSAIKMNGKPAVLGIILDTTDRKKLERELQQAQKLESIGNLAGGIAHDFNNILSSIIGFTELALYDVEKGTPLEDNLNEVYTAGIRATDLVKQILAFARQSEEEQRPIQISMIAQEVLKFIRSTIPSTIEIKQNIESQSMVLGNKSQVHQIFMNLCTNAAQSMEDNGGILKVDLTDINQMELPPDLKADLKADNYIKLTVSDDGYGIPDGIIDSIFEPYFTTKNVGKGTGMGLALVHGIVESYRGKITVRSEINKGSIFTIYLPTTKKSKIERKSDTEKLPVGNERILVVDDELPIAKMVSRILESLGYRVTIRTSSIEALELFRSKSYDFDLVITDMTMPNMTGDDLTKALLEIRDDIPVILLTGYSNKISEDSATQTGIKAFAYKPILKAKLAKIVRKILDES